MQRPRISIKTGAAIIALAFLLAIASVILGCGKQDATPAPAAPNAPAASTSSLYFTQQAVRPSPGWVCDLDAAKDPDCKQMIVVAGVDKSTAYITMHERDARGNWQQLIATPGFIGLDGLGPANINDCYTPVGTFTVDAAFGLAPDPGCKIPYKQVDDSYYWSGDARPGMHFNELVSVNDLPDLDVDECEHIADFDYAYQYVLNMGYNSECIPDKGFAFFFHSFRYNRPYTGGCVAVPEDIMIFIMQHIEPGCRFVIDSLDNMGGDLDA